MRALPACGKDDRHWGNRRVSSVAVAYPKENKTADRRTVNSERKPGDVISPLCALLELAPGQVVVGYSQVCGAWLHICESIASPYELGTA